MEKQTITIYDVAREAGVSMATVSRVVNGNPNVKPSTRKKVSDVIERLNYRPNAVARGLASKRTTTVGVIIPSVTNLFYASLARGIDDIAAMYKYNILLANSDENTDKKMTVFNTLLAQQVDGIIFMGYNVDQAMQEAIQSSNTPVVFAGTVLDNENAYQVNIDYRQATEEATARLLKNHRKVALLVSSKEALIHQYRSEGFKAAHEAAGMSFDDGQIVEILDEKEVEVRLEELLAENYNAVIATDDVLAATVLNNILDRGIAVPEDFEVITTNNSMITEITRPSLSSVALPLYDIGAVAMRLLTKIMNEEEIEEKQVILPHRFIERGTTLNEAE